MSRLEKFIKDHRDEFDDQTPPENLWKRVEASLPNAKRSVFPIKKWFKWLAAAAVVIMVVAITFLVTKKQPVETLVVKPHDTATTDLAYLAPEQAPEVNQFARLIADKQEELKTIAKEQPALYQKFSKDLTQLDSSYNMLKNRLGLAPNRELLIEAMIQNLELQLRVLNQQLSIIQQIKKSKNYRHEKIDPSI